LTEKSFSSLLNKIDSSIALNALGSAAIAEKGKVCWEWGFEIMIAEEGRKISKMYGGGSVQDLLDGDLEEVTKDIIDSIRSLGPFEFCIIVNSLGGCGGLKREIAGADSVGKTDR
jgi:hypothetical protein